MKVNFGFMLGILLTGQVHAHQVLYCPEISDIFSMIYLESSTSVPGSDPFLKEVEEKYFVPKIDCERVAEMAYLLRETKSLAEKQLAVPQNGSTLVVHPLHTGASANSSSMMLPYRYYQGVMAKHPRYTRAVWIHEYAHLVFREELMKAFPELHEEFLNKEKVDSMQLTISIFEERIAQIQEEQKKSTDQVQLLALQEEQTQTEELIKNLFFNSGEMAAASAKQRNLSLMAMPYNELFADLVAVIMSQDLDAVQNALNVDDESHYPEYTNRSFQDAQNELDKWVAVEEDHQIFAPTRYHLGKYFIDDPFFSTNPERLLRTVMDICLNEIRINLNEQKNNLDYKLNPILINKRFIEQLDEYKNVITDSL